MNNKLIYRLILQVILGTIGYQASTFSADMCELETTRPGENLAFLEGDVSYFISTFPKNPNLVGVIGLTEENYIIDMGSKPDVDGYYKKILVPGGVDPVFTPDGRLLTTPGVFFYDATDILQKFSNGDESAKNVKEIYVDNDMDGAYQSIGMPNGYQLQSSANGNKQATYRIIIESLYADGGQGESNLTVRDYTVPYLSSGKVDRENITKGTQFKLCPNQKLKTPRISKSGKYLAAYSVTDEATKIFSVEITKDANNVESHTCNELTGIEFGIRTGKVDFNFKDDLITYHISRFETTIEPEDWPRTISDNEKRDVYVAEIKNEALASVTRVTPPTDYGEGGWYPSFAQDDQLVYMTKLAKSNDRSYGLVRVNPRTMEFMPYAFSPDNLAEKPKRDAHALHAIANIAKQSCNWNRNLDSALVDILTLSPQGCKDMVNNHWVDPSKSDLLLPLTKGNKKRLDLDILSKLTQADALEMCDKLTRTGNIGPVIIPDPIAPVGRDIIGGCNYCHFRDGGNISGIRRIDFTKPSTLTLEDFNQSIQMIKYKPMPMLFTNASEQTREKNLLMPQGGGFGGQRKKLAECFLMEERAKKFPIASTLANNCGIFPFIPEYELEANLPIKDGGTIESTLDIAATDAMVSTNFKIKLIVNYSSEYNLELTLVSPKGTKVKLYSGQFSFGNISGIYPVQHDAVDSLAELTGEPLTGQWKLIVTDEAAIPDHPDSGHLVYWAIGNN